MTTRTRGAFPRVVGGLLLGAALVAGCGTEPAAQQPPAAVPVKATAAPATTPPVTARPTPTGPASPLTGTRPAPTAGLVALKVDNSPLARPYHVGLDRAAVVYEELMEGGSTRFLALFDGSDRREVGPIRSVRENDIELLRPYGKVAVGFSGGNTGVKRKFAAAVRAGRVLDASYDALPSSYRLGALRKDARNFFTVPATLVRQRPQAVVPRDVGFRFGPALPGAPTRTARVGFSHIARVDVRYDPPSGKWAVFQDGQRMRGVAAANIVVQRVRVRGSQYSDVNGQVSPFSVTTGSGEVTVLRDGRRTTGTWKRLGAATGTRYYDAKGRDIALKPGPTWVLLLPSGRPLTFG
ncbi:MAG: DUF3048 domain-containing protein [Mycobacteriales bacterium]|nr:DUF3048 domain-containing protein [Mycobacteriales bacterium]